MAFGYDVLLRQTFHGFRVHILVAWPGVIVRFSLSPANVHETAVVPELVHGRQGVVVGNRNYWHPTLRETLAPQGPPQPRPLPDRYGLRSTRGPLPHQACVRTRDLWHLGHCLLRKVLSHTLAFLLNQGRDHPPLQLSKQVT